jgi:hypothetical protein
MHRLVGTVETRDNRGFKIRTVRLGQYQRTIGSLGMSFDRGGLAILFVRIR